MKLPGTPDIRLSIGLLNPNRDSMKLPTKVPIAAPSPAILGVENTAKRAGTTIPGLKCPTPHGVGIGAVAVIAKAYNAAHEIIRATSKLLPSKLFILLSTSSLYRPISVFHLENTY